MIRFSNSPTKPYDFDVHVRQAKATINAIIERYQTPKSTDFENKWSRFKTHLFNAQHHKCGYCELFLQPSPGDVEHYRPKAKLQELPLDTTEWGKEAKGLHNVKGRSPRTVSNTGYWWEAYTWENYLAACSTCNSGWKRNLFPVKESPRKSPQIGQDETPLLLNPFKGPDPVDHLAYTRVGQIMPFNNSLYGKATIETCGLDRPSLVKARNEKVTRAFRLVDEYGKAKNVEERMRAIQDLIEMGSEEHHFAGMVRSIFKQELELPWDKFKAVL